MSKCPFFGKCGGCQFDFSASEYQSEKESLLGPIKPNKILWIQGQRRRAEFAFLNEQIGFFAAHSKDIIEISKCPLLADDINKVLPILRKNALPGAGSILITKCENGLAIDFNANVNFYNFDMNDLGAVQVSWNNRIVVQKKVPTVFGRTFKPNGFLQPTLESEQVMRDFVATNATGKIADLFSGIGTLTIGLKANEFDLFDSGYNHVHDLIHDPLRAKKLEQYDTIVMDPPRNGAEHQSVEIAKTKNKKVIYISCNPISWLRDKKILESGNLKCTKLVAVDQFVGSKHWELMSVFE
jgi:23S rRNA (uracil1939-C5)-methyltransferase